MVTDRMQIDHDEGEELPNYGSLFLVERRKTGVNDYGGGDETDAANLPKITNALPGSTCLFDNGNIYRLNISGEWVKIGDDA